MTRTESKSTATAVGAVLLLCGLAALARSACAQENSGIIYAVERDRIEKNFFSIDFSGRAGLEPEVNLVANMTDAALQNPSSFPFQCFGYVDGAAASGTLYEFSPNALASDGAARLYFAAFDRFGDTLSRLCFYSMATGTFNFAALLGDLILGATFDAYSYQYVWIDEGKEQAENGILMLQFARLNRQTGRVIEVVTRTRFRDVTTDPNAPTAELPFTFRGGDLAIDCLGNLYGSSVGTGGGFKAFFTIDLAYFTDLDNSTGLEYRLIHRDPSEGPSDATSLTGFATADQLAFDSTRRLISQDSQRGIFSVVDKETGANGELGEEGVDFVRLTEMGSVRLFADLASFLDCGVRARCFESDVLDPCTNQVFTLLTPAQTGDVPCVLEEGRCQRPDNCDMWVPCSYYVRIQA